mmetsp:Transcript_2753/g.5971  ORF Transcript_2753/g.5971 Transcript_2753/m.5971 type:complete len:121 (-) Transcript_2753:627-989(-)
MNTCINPTTTTTVKRKDGEKKKTLSIIRFSSTRRPQERIGQKRQINPRINRNRGTKKETLINLPICARGMARLPTPHPQSQTDLPLMSPSSEIQFKIFWMVWSCPVRISSWTLLTSSLSE